MRIIVVSEAATISGGAEKVALTSAVALAKCGIPTTVFAGTGPIDVRLQDIPHLTVHCTGQRPYYENSDAVLPIRQTLWNSDAALAFRSVLAIHKPSETVVHFHSYLRVHSGAVMAAALDLGFPSIITLHDYALACPGMGFYNFMCQEICPLTPAQPPLFRHKLHSTRVWKQVGAFCP
jgi:UDP-N-acetylglucosamine:LPS N-acetylglucosamine transferase